MTITTELGEQGSTIDCDIEVQGCLHHAEGYWEFDDEDGTSSTGENDLTLTSASFTPGILGQAMICDSDSLGEVSGSGSSSHALTRQPGTSFTVALWFFLPSTAYDNGGGGIANVNGQTPLNKGEEVFTNADYEYRLLFYQPAGGTLADVRLYWLLSDGADVGTGVGVIDLGRPTVSTWHFVVAGFDDSVPQPFGKIDNGALQTYAPFGHDAALSKGFTFKVGASESGSGDHHFEGLIDSVGFWKCVLTEDEMTALYNSGAGLAYPFDGA